MRLALSRDFAKRSLFAHTWLGLLLGAPMYLVCLTGTLLVYHEELARWAEPDVEEFTEFANGAVAAAFNELFASDAERTSRLTVFLPTETLPRLRFESQKGGWFMNEDGSIGPQEEGGWLDALQRLHFYLHLPRAWGVVAVSGLGAFLVALILSGLFGHRRLFRDAFKLRLGGNRQLAQTDLHNRLSVWGTPFYLMIGITGAYFGFALIVLGVYADLHAGGDRTAVVQSVFGEAPRIEAGRGPLMIESVLEQMAVLAPDEAPIRLTVHNADSPDRYLEVRTALPRRFTHSERYVFTADGRFSHKHGFSDGDAGKQVIYSLYRLHAGQFGEVVTKVFYGLLGLAMTVVCATGMNIWLAKRRSETVSNDLWAGIVWGAPVALAVSALAAVCFGIVPVPVFWSSYGLVVGYCLFRRDERSARRRSQAAGAAALLALAACHVAVFRSQAAADMAVNTTLAVTAVVLLLLCSSTTRQPGMAQGRVGPL